MPAADIQRRRAGLALVPGLLWTGVGLAPVAALLVLFVGDNSNLLRFAVLLAIIAVALIGSSLALRRDSDAVRDEVEDMLVEELDALRDDVRADITTAARATHKAFGERVVSLQESVNSLRGEVENLRVRVERGGVPAQRVGSPVPPVPVTPAPTPSAAPHGLVRHTETVKVTRQTIVDQNDAGRGSGTVYGNRVDQGPAVPAQRHPEQSTAQVRGDAESGESWSERLLRQHLGEEPRGTDRYDEPRYDEPRYDEPRYDEPRYDEPRYGIDRSAPPAWSGERHDGWRASVRADPTGTEYRVEGRWSAVRRDEARDPEPHRDPGRAWERGSESGTYRSHEAQRGWEVSPAQGSWSGARYPASSGEQPGRPSEPGYGWSGTRPALPAAPSEPSASTWLGDWESRPDQVGDRTISWQPDDEGYPRRGPARSPRATGYDDGQERWR